MSNPQLEDGFVRIANEIWNEVIRRDFSKRQLNILFFIWRLSYGCNKKTAKITKQKDFEICGVGQQNIRSELKYLSECNVITIENGNEYSVNKRINEWQISPIKGWNLDRFKEILHQNIEGNFLKREEKTSQNKKNSEGENNETSQNKKSELLKTRRLDFSKQEVFNDSNPCGSKLEGVSKDSIKDSIKDISTTSTMGAMFSEDENQESITTVYQKVFGTMMMNGLMSEYIQSLLKSGQTESFVKEVLYEVGESGNNPNLNFMKSIAERWISEGITSRAEARKKKQASNVKPFNRSRGRPNKPQPITHMPDDTEMSEEEMLELQAIIKELDG